MRVLVTCRVSIVSHDAAQFRISSCHQVSQGVERSTSAEIVDARFMAQRWLIQSVDGGGVVPDLPNLPNLPNLFLGGRKRRSPSLYLSIITTLSKRLGRLGRLGNPRQCNGSALPNLCQQG